MVNFCNKNMPFCVFFHQKSTVAQGGPAFSWVTVAVELQKVPKLAFFGDPKIEKYPIFAGSLQNC